MRVMVREARKLRKLTQQQTATASGVSRSAIACIEAGRRTRGPQLGTLTRLARALDVPAALLLAEPPSGEKETP